MWQRCGSTHTATRAKDSRSDQPLDRRAARVPHAHTLNGRFPMLPDPNQRSRHGGFVPGDWPLRSLETIEHLLPHQVMALFPDLGSWLRSVRGDTFTSSPVLAVEKLNSVPRPLQDADKEVLVGAVLTMSSSLHLALSLLRELLPQEKSRERLGEVLCPTLGHLLAAVQSTLSAFGPAPGSTPVTRPPTASQTAISQPLNGSTPSLAAHQSQVPQTLGEELERSDVHIGRHPRSSSRPTRPRHEVAETEGFPPLEDGPGPHELLVEDARERPETHHLVKALQAEMRVQAAIHVAVESLEFAEGQLKVVKEVNELHGGNFDLLQKNFYEGYNRLVIRALELQRRELGLSASGSLMSAGPVQHPYRQTEAKIQSSPKQQHSVWFQNTPSARSPVTTPRANGTIHSASSERRRLGRRNTIQGIRQEDSRALGTRPPFKRRLSLADELAMVGEDSESGYQDETSEGASSANELQESDLDACHESLHGSSRETEGEESSINGEGEESADDNGDNEDGGDETLGASEIMSREQAATTSSNHSRSRLPRLQHLHR